MDNREAVNWLINISADIGKAEHSDLWHYEQALTEIKDMLESIQTDATDTNVGDTISRQAAIDALDFEIVHITAYCDGKNEGNPLAQYNKGLEDGKKAIEALPTVQLEPKWIPVSERLPEIGGEYLVSVRWYREDDIDIDVYDYDARCKEWNDGESCGQRVIAWMPLPEPYKPNK